LSRVQPAFCDSSVLVAALDAGHPHFRPCIDLLGSLREGGAYCALHSYAEVYAVLSGKPGKPKLRPLDVDAMIDRLDAAFTPIALTRREYRAVVHKTASLGAAGGQLYDALILECGIKSGADVIYTLNERDFQALAPPEVRPKIRRP
jgi:predicted nucleic acid-binding protein